MSSYTAEEIEATIASRPRYQAVEGVPGLVLGKNPLYVPQDLACALSEPSFISIAEMASVASAIWDTGDANAFTTLNLLKETTAVPQSSHIQVLRAIRSRCEVDISNLGTEIQRVHQDIIDLTEKLTRLSTKHIQKQNIASACTSFLSPLRRLPPETLGEIFLHCMPSHGRPVVSEAPLLLAHICSAWRKAAFGFPLLWTNLSLTTPELPPRNTTSQSLAHIIRLWFNCAKNSPLTFKFRNNYDSDRGATDRSIIDAVIPYAGRFRKLHLAAVSIYDILEFVTLPPGRVNMLESLQLEIEDFYDLNETKITAFENAPLLRELTLDINTNPHSDLSIPWKQLTRISAVEGVTLYQSDMLSILCECEQLASCSFKITTGMGDEWLDDAFPDDDPIVLNHLNDLGVMLSERDTPADRFVVFDKLALPALVELMVAGAPRENLGLSDVPLGTFVRRASVLRNLTLLGLALTHTELLSVLRSTPCLTFLKLSLRLAVFGYAPLMEALTIVQGQSNVYVPKLRSLEIYIPAESDDFQHAVPEFMAMVRSRQIMETSVDEATGKHILPPAEYLCTTLSIDGTAIANPSLQISVLRSADHDGEIELYVSGDEEEQEEGDEGDEDGDDVIMHHL